MGQYRVQKFNRDEWLNGQEMSVCYHEAFSDKRLESIERCDYALAVLRDEKLCAFVTCIEMDGETLYWQFGGAFDEIKKTISVIESYQAAIDKSRDLGFKRITTRIENTNIAMLKLAMKCGFLIVGTWNFKNTVYLELLNEFEENVVWL